jgi:DNA primase
MNNHDFYTELKSKNDIIEVAQSLGYSGHRSGSCYQGECPKHGSTDGVCLVIWPKIQGWRCYHCGAKGDVIKLVRHYKNYDNKTAVKFLADRAGIPYLGCQTLSPEEIVQRENDIAEKVLVEDMLTEATRWYHERLNDYPEIKDHLINHYGFSTDIIEELQIGFAPVSKRLDHTSELAIHLNSIPEFKSKIALTGLFSFSNPQGPYYDYFKGRIIFPYWNGGKVVYMTGRASSLTPTDEYECYPKKEGKPLEFIKYKKLRSHDPDDEKKNYISRFIQNDVFMGEDTVRGADEIIIAEGAPDWVSAIDKGFNAISPVTTTFREKDFEKLERLTQGAKSIFIINDNEENEAGLKGSLKTGKYLTEKGRNVFLVELPRPEGLSKIDLNEYFKDHSAEDLKELMSKSKSVLEILIDGLPDNYLRAQPHIKEEIAPLLINLDGGMLQHYTTLLAKRVKTNVKTVTLEIEAARKLKVEKESRKEEVKIDPEVEKGALSLTLDPMVFKKRIDVVNRAGVVGERKNIAMYCCAIDSRLIPDDFQSPNVLAVKNAGHYGSGKSYSLSTCVLIYPENAYYMITNGSAKSLYYLEGGLKHKALIVTEGFQFQENNAADSELVYVIRSLISEGRIRYCVPEKDKDGILKTVEKKLDGPTSFITTTIMDKLEDQMDDRLFSIHPDEGIQQTKDITTMTASQKSGNHPRLDMKTIDTWKHYHNLLKPVEVVIPFILKVADFMNENTIVPLSTRRAFKRVLIVIQSVTCAYQYQRKRNDEGKLIAEMGDYYMALQIVEESFRENMGAPDGKTKERLIFIKEKGKVFSKDIAEKYGVSASAISSWTTQKVKGGILTWCDENGNLFIDDKDLGKAKRSGKAYLKVADDYDKKTVTGLPSPFKLTGDSEWDKNGKLLEMYDLELKKSHSADKVFNGVLDVFRPPLNTSEGGEDVNHIPKSDDEDQGVKVLIGNTEDDNKYFDDDIEDEFLGISSGGNGNEINATLTPWMCRKGCKYYDGYHNPEGEHKEECIMTNRTIIAGTPCILVEPKGGKLPEGVLTI